MGISRRNQQVIQPLPDPVESAKALKEVFPPPAVATPFGKALWGGSGYGFDNIDTDATAKENVFSAFKGLKPGFKTLEDPGQFMQDERSRYRSFVQPQFEDMYERGVADVTSGLGNKYFSTFGQLTASQRAKDLALARGELERDIYESGEKGLDRLIARMGSSSDLLSAAMNARMIPYQTLGQLLQVAGANQSGSNQAAIGAYSPYIGALAQQNAASLYANRQQNSGLGALLASQGVNILRGAGKTAVNAALPGSGSLLGMVGF